MNKFQYTYDKFMTPQFLIEKQSIRNELKLRLIMDGIYLNDNDLNDLMKLYEELNWWQHGLLHLGGTIDPSGLIDLGHAVYYFDQGQILSGILTLLGAIPYIGDTAKVLIPFFKAGKSATSMVNTGFKAGFHTKNASISAANFLLKNMPRIERGLTLLVTKMIKNPSMRRILIKIFGKDNLTKNVIRQSRSVYRSMRPVKSVVRGPGGRYMNSTTPGSTLANAPVDTSKIVEIIVKKMLSMIDKPLRAIAGPRLLKNPIKATMASAAKGGLYNMDFSEVPYLSQYSTASTKEKDREQDELEAARSALKLRIQSRQAQQAQQPQQNTPTTISFDGYEKTPYNIKLGN